MLKVFLILCSLCVAHSTFVEECESTPFNAKQNLFRCYKLSPQANSWDRSYCGPGGHLAVDNSTESHAALTRLLNKEGVNQAWIGGRTEPLYWNWMASKRENTSSEPLFYQGCYKLDNYMKLQSTISHNSSFLIVCQGICLSAGKELLGLSQKENSNDFHCYCGSKIGTQSGSCSRCNIQKSLSCGNSESVAIYHTAFTNTIVFLELRYQSHLSNSTESYLQYQGPFRKYNLQNAPAENKAPALCVKKNGCHDVRGEIISGKCYYETTITSWIFALEECLKTGGEMLDLTSETTIGDIRHLRRFWRFYGIPHWVRGTTLVWIWKYKNTIKTIIGPQYWLDSHEPYSLSNKCIVLQTSPGTNVTFWNSSDCSTRRSFICQHVKEIALPTDVTTRGTEAQNSWSSVETSISSSEPLIISTMKEARNSWSSSETLNSSSEPEHVHAAKSQLASKTAQYIGAGVGGAVLIIIIIIIIIILIVKKIIRPRTNNQRKSLIVDEPAHMYYNANLGCQEEEYEETKNNYYQNTESNEYENTQCGVYQNTVYPKQCLNTANSPNNLPEKTVAETYENHSIPNIAEDKEYELLDRSKSDTHIYQ